MLPRILRPWCRGRQFSVCLATVLALGSTGAGQQPHTGVDAAQAARLNPSDYVPSEVLVQFRSSASAEARAVARAAARAVVESELRPGAGLELLNTSLPVPDAVAILAALPEVEFAEPNWIVERQSASDDPYYTNGSLWGMQGDGTGPSNQFGSQAAEAWAAGLTGSQAVYVAVLDEGIDVSHPDLAPNIWTNPFDPVDGIDNDGNGYVDDTHGWDFAGDNRSVYDGSPDSPDVDGHGTHVAGIIGARGGNGIGVAGVSWNVTLISAKILGTANGTNGSVVRALDYIADLKTRHGLNIVATNNSWNFRGIPRVYSMAMHQAIIRAAKQGILFIAAAGDGDTDGIGDDQDWSSSDTSTYSTTIPVGSESPAPYEAVVSVAALTPTGERAPFSDYGALTVDVGAPGVDIVSTWPQGGYKAMSGTSMAAPHVAGAAALYKAANPSASAAGIRSAILGHGIPTPALSGITTTGRRLNVGEFAGPLRLSIADTYRFEADSAWSNASFAVSLPAPSAAPVSVRYRTESVTAFSHFSFNTNLVTMPRLSSISSYPLSVTVPPGSGTVTSVFVELRGFSHESPGDVDILLVGPGGQTCLLMSDVGDGNYFDSAVDDIDLWFLDTGVPMPTTMPLESDRPYRPTNFGADDAFPSPAPAGPYGSTLSVFNGTPAAGEWRLFIVDDGGGGEGMFSGGLDIGLTTTSGDDYAAVRIGTLNFAPGVTTRTIQIPIYGDTAVEPSETFKVHLFDSVGASIADGEALGTIVNDDIPAVVTNGQLIRSSHILEARAAIDSARLARGLARFTFTDPALTVSGTHVRVAHILELRAAVAEIYEKVALSPPIFSDPTIVPRVTVIKAAHINEIHAAVADLP